MKTENNKNSVVKILCYLLLLLFLGCVAFYVINSKEETNEEDQIVDVEPGDDVTDGDGSDENEDIKEEPAQPEVIEFFLEKGDVGVTIVFEVGMTWEEWVNSDYNTDGFTICENNYVRYLDKPVGTLANGPLKCTSLISLDLIEEYYIIE